MGVKIKSGLKKNWGKNKKQVEKKNLGKKKMGKSVGEKKITISYQLPVISYQLSVTSYQLPVTR